MICSHFLIICTFTKITAQPGESVHPSILFEPIFFEVVPVVQGKRVHLADKNIIEADPLLRRSIRENVAISFPNQQNYERINLSSKPSHKIDFPISKVDERLVLGHVNGDNTLTKSSVTEDSLDVDTGTTDLGAANSTFYDSLAEQECLLKNGFILYRENCSRLLSDIPCDSTNHWLIINQLELPECVERPCPVEQLLYKGKCHQTSDDSMCGSSEILYVDFTGDVYCDCEQRFLFDGNQCIAEHRQGSCPAGSFLENQNGISCVPNPCVSDDLVMNPADEKCYRKTFEGKCDSGEQHSLELSFNPDDKTAICLLTDAIATRNIFELPASSSCPVGSKRNFMNECKETFGSFATPSQFTARYSMCPPMHVRYPNGACKKVNKIL